MQLHTRTWPVEHPVASRGGFRVDTVNVLLFTAGSVATVIAYSSIVPVMLAALALLLWKFILGIPALGGKNEEYMFSRVFCANVLAAGIAAIYANHLGDPGQLYSDAAGFYELASSGVSGLSLEQIAAFHDGALAIWAWSSMYDVFAGLGLGRERYVGVLANVTLVSFSSVLACKMATEVFGADVYRLKRLATLFSWCGMFWVFGGLHLRDAWVLAIVSSVVAAWVHFLKSPGALRLTTLAVTSATCGYLLGFLRVEFVFVPLALALAGAAALLLGGGGSRMGVARMFFGVVALVAGVLVYAQLGEEVMAHAERGREFYFDVASEGGDTSLGFSLIVNQPMPFRVLLGSAYLFVFPVPFWSGIQLESVYDLFKACNALFSYVLVPLLLLAAVRIFRVPVGPRQPLLFLAAVLVGFMFAIAGTSLESRHFGVFLVPALVLALLPDLRRPSDRRAFRVLFGLLLSGMGFIHFAWLYLKAG